jgi:hypothetical protein
LSAPTPWQGTSGTTGAAQEQRMAANVEQYIGQLFTPLLFSAHCTARHLPFLEGQVDPSNTTKMQAVRQVRDGVAQQVMGLMQMAADATLDAPRRQRIMELLAKDAGEFAVGLTAPQRQQIVAAAQELEAMLPPICAARPDVAHAGHAGRLRQNLFSPLGAALTRWRAGARWR